MANKRKVLTPEQSRKNHQEAVKAQRIRNEKQRN
jgi:hypothetical protein